VVAICFALFFLWRFKLGFVMLAVLVGPQTYAKLAVMAIVVVILAWWRRRKGMPF
jgi:hypothetical protein